MADYCEVSEPTLSVEGGDNLEYMSVYYLARVFLLHGVN
jgi:hypothetical protein